MSTLTVKGKFISPSHFRVFAQAQYIKQLERSKWLFIYSVKNPFDMNFHISIKPKYIYIYIVLLEAYYPEIYGVA